MLDAAHRPCLGGWVVASALPGMTSVERAEMALGGNSRTELSQLRRGLAAGMRFLGIHVIEGRSRAHDIFYI